MFTRLHTEDLNVARVPEPESLYTYTTVFLYPDVLKSYEEAPRGGGLRVERMVCHSFFHVVPEFLPNAVLRP
jgi:hypothetical protein